MTLSLFKVGGIWWLKVGRVNLSMSVSRVRKHRAARPQGPLWGTTNWHREQQANKAMAQRMARA